jgi:hypothetical protein
MTEQLSFFQGDYLRETSVSTEGHKKTCSTCREEFYIPEGYHRSGTYCPSCRAGHAKIRKQLKRDNPIPVNHRCECCGKSEDELTIHYGRYNKPVSPWRIDHCHETGKFRGWLCINCNTGLGRFYDDPNLLNKAIQYLQKNRL